MKTVDNYKNLGIKISKTGDYFVYADVRLSERAKVRLGQYNSIEDAKSGIDDFWKRFSDRIDEALKTMKEI